MSYHFSDFIGNIGVFIALSTYLLVQLRKMNGAGIIYPLLNILASFLILYSLIFSFNLSSFLVETLWILISVTGIIRHFIIKYRIDKI
ncbi:MAG: hypothetical protein GY756_22445 [bacterium]|nr:hypothetical protein [bacterium]